MQNNQSTPPQQKSREDSISLVLTACVISILLIYLVYTRNFIFGSKSGNWVYPFLSSAPEFPVWRLSAIILLLGLLIFLGLKYILVREKITLFVLLLCGVLIQFLIRDVYPYALGAIIQSDGANSFYSAAIHYSPDEILSKFIDIAPSFPLHAKANMPGKILLFEFYRLFTSSPETMGYLVIVLSSIGALLLYGICKRLFYDRKTAFYASLLYLLIPGKIFFLPLLNTVTPVLMLLCFYLLVVHLDNKSLWSAWLLGISGYLLIFFEPSPLITGFILIGIVLQALREKIFSIKDLYRLIFHASLAFLITYFFLYILYGFDIIRVFLYVVKEQQKFMSVYERGYSIWLIENCKEFFLGAGIPVVIIFIYMVAHIAVQTKSVTQIIQWPLENILIISILVTYAVLLMLGINRGEITRLWIYLAVLFQIPAAIFMAKIERGTLLFLLVASLMAIQAMISLHRVGFVIP